MTTPDMADPTVITCLRRYDPDPAHAKQVCRLSLLLFDALATVHGMGAHERTLLRDAALLHDTGWYEGRRKHHKHSMEIIMDDRSLPFPDRDRQIIAQVARYHRRADPTQEHEAFAALDSTAQQTVTGLAAILRIADGLDVTHRSAITSLRCDVESDAVVISYAAERPAPAEEAQAAKKSTLFTRVYQHRIVIRWVHLL